MARATGKKRRAARPPEGARRVLGGLAGALGALALVAALEPVLWVGGLVAELGFHLALCALALGCVALWARAYLPLAGLLASAAVLASPLVPLFRGSRPTPQKGPLLRVAAMHLGAPPATAALERFLTHQQPDALALSGAQMAVLGARVGSYRVLRGAASATTALLVQRVLLTPERAPTAWPSASVRVGRCQARIVAFALPSRASFGARDARERTVAELSEAKVAPRSVWLGQLGSRAEAHDLTRFTAHHGLRDARLGHGRLATAPSALGPLGFPLAHVLVHGWISVRDVMTQPAMAPGAQRSLTAVLELTEPRCRFDPASGSE